MKWLELSILGMLLHAPVRAREVQWLDRLEEGCAKARAEKKLVLYRQAICDCKDDRCPYAEALRKPSFLDDPATRELIARECVAVAVRVTPDRDMQALKDPGYGSLLTKGSPLRTFLLSPDGYILDRLDFCSYSGDLAGEIDYAHMVRLTCFDPAGSPDPEAPRILRDLHEQHVNQPKSWHKAKGGAFASECRCPSPRQGPSGGWKPWRSYNQGISWHTDLEEAKVWAKHSKRSLLCLQVVGDLYKEGC